MEKLKPLAYCKDKSDYIRIALAIETLTYHNKNYLNGCLCDNAVRSIEMQRLLYAALEQEG